jgi:hypothetical protein
MSIHSRSSYFGLAAALIALLACSDSATDPEPIIPTGSAEITADILEDRTLYAETTYTLKGYIHVANGATLTIRAGTVIKGDYATVGSSLFVLRGAKIMAVGEVDKPIVFTSAQPANSRSPGDWGGLVIVGNAVINRGGVTGGIEIEGSGTVAGNVSGTNYKVTYDGGTTNTDNSGELKYVRVEFAGFGVSLDKELNSFTFAAVGSGTKLSYLQSLAGLDDSFEWFGGAVDADHLVSYESGDDHFDMSEGYVGRLQHIVGLQTTVLTPRANAGITSSDPQGIENDGCNGTGCSSDAHNSAPLTIPLVANFTLIGTGSTNSSASSGGIGILLRRGAGGYYVNGILARWPRAGISIRDASTYGRAGGTATPDISTTDLAVRNVVLIETPTMFQTGANQNSFDATANAIVSNSAGASEAFTAFPATTNETTTEAAFDWTPVGGSSPSSGGLDSFSGKLAARATTPLASGHVLTGTSYRGAAQPGGSKWWQGWTRYAQK